jgi:uncharacterized membrane protein
MTGKVEDRFFVLSMWWRIAYGTLRIIFGLALFKAVGSPLLDTISQLMSFELVQDPTDKLYGFASQLLGQDPMYVSYFLAIYFIFWGLVDVVLSINLLRGKIWAFPASLLLIGGFIIYEFIRFTYTHSLILLFIIFVDIIIFWFIEREYKKLN